MDDKKVLIAMSGGVDSSVAALLLQEAGFGCIGVTMRLFDTAAEDDPAKKAAAVCARLGIEHHVADLTDEFKEAVIEPFVAAYERGCTPNPCIACNRRLKFGALLKTADSLGCRYLATGHYAQKVRDEESGCCYVSKAADLNKDQSYVLYNLTQEQLARVLFPLGGLTKTQVRQLAAAHDFANARQKESQDICFIPAGKYADFICRYRGQSCTPGDFVDETGKVLGKHKGLIYYTVGQRKGLGLALPAPLYVKGLDREQNRVILAPEAALYNSTVEAEEVNLACGGDWRQPRQVLAKARYRHKEQPATACLTKDHKLVVRFASPQRALTKGQALVLYEGARVLGGGLICGVSP